MKLHGSLLLLIVGYLLLPATLYAQQDDAIQVMVIDPYLDVHTGPGRGYPIFRVVKQGDWIAIDLRKNQWFKIVTTNGETGWVPKEQLERTLNPEGEQITVTSPDQQDFAARQWEAAILYGDQGGTPVMEFSGLYVTTANLALEGSYGIGVGSHSSNQHVSLGIIHQPFPSWRVSPYVSLGGGAIRISPKATLVKSERREEQFAHTAFGIRSYLSQRFLLRMQYKEFLLFNSDEDNEEIKEWKIGFAVFF